MTRAAWRRGVRSGLVFGLALAPLVIASPLPWPLEGLAVLWASLVLSTYEVSQRP